TVVTVGGEAHRQVFRVECRVDELGVAAVGEGGSRRAAEQQAAESVLALMAGQRAGGA
ncbi:ribonuclease III, partial [sediment metagenome]